MNTKQEMVDRVKDLLNSKGIKNLFLKDNVFATWPYESIAKPYTISRIAISDNDGFVYAWQHWDFSNVGHKLLDFKEDEVFKVVEHVEESVKALKKFRVSIKGEIDVLATTPLNATKSINYDCAEVERVYYYVPEDALVKEV